MNDEKTTSKTPTTPTASMVSKVLTSKGFPIRIRRVQPEDAAHLVDLFEHLSAESRYLRFNQSLEYPDPALVARTAAEMALVAPPAGEAWLAFADGDGSEETPVERTTSDGTPIGGARYVNTSLDEAEIAIAVRDDYQGRGVAFALLEVVLKGAYAAGIRVISGAIRHDNLPLLAMIKKVPWEVTWQHDGPYASVKIDLTTWHLVQNNEHATQG